MSDYERDLAISLHSQIRSEFNINPDLTYSMEMEAAAQAWADGCKTGDSNNEYASLQILKIILINYIFSRGYNKYSINTKRSLCSKLDTLTN
jgi:hypothetical protein